MPNYFSSISEQTCLMINTAMLHSLWWFQSVATLSN